MVQQMKKRFLSAALAVLLTLSPLPARAAEPAGGESGDDEAALSSLASVVLHPGGQTVLTALSGSGYDWRVDDASIVDFTRKNGASATVAAKRPGKTTVWVFYTAVKDGLVQYPDGSFRPGTETYATNERWEIAVVPEGTSTGPETEKYGTVGEDVSGALSDIGLYNPALDLMPVQQEETGLWGYADGTFRLVIPCEYDTLCYPSYPSGGYLAYKRGGEFGLMRNPLHPPENAVRVKGFASGNTASVVTLADPGGFLRRCGTVYAASFQQGQLKALALGRLDGGEAAFEEALPAGCRLFFLDAAHAPVCKEAVLE